MVCRSCRWAAAARAPLRRSWGSTTARPIAQPLLELMERPAAGARPKRRGRRHKAAPHPSRQRRPRDAKILRGGADTEDAPRLTLNVYLLSHGARELDGLF